MSNTLYPNLETPNLHKCIDQVFGPPLATEAEADAARQELAYLKQCVKDCKDQMERSSKALGESSAERMKLVDKLCNIRNNLVKGYKSNPWAYIRVMCKKHFSLDVTT